MENISSAHDVFISHSFEPKDKDKYVANKVCAALESNSIKCWIAPRDIVFGDDFQVAIVNAINRCKVVVFIWSSHSQGRKYVICEIRNAFEKDKEIVPFRIEETKLNKELELVLQSKHSFDAFPDPLEENISILVDALRYKILPSIKHYYPNDAKLSEDDQSNYFVTGRDEQQKYAECHGLKLELKDKLGIDFSLIPPGRLIRQMKGKKTKIHILKPIYVSRCPITQAQYKDITGKEAGHFKFRGKNRPVECVNWFNAVKFCSTASQKAGMKPPFIFDQVNGNKFSLSYNGYRLPTSAEWQYFCLAGSEGDYCFGNDIAMLPDYAWYRENSGANETHKVAQKMSNEWGLFDTHGNVFEWCVDPYNASLSTIKNSSEYLYPVDRTEMVLCGGAYNSSADDCSCSRIGKKWASGRGDTTGFRIVREIESK